MKLHVIGLKQAGGEISRRFLESSLKFIVQRLPPLKAAKREKALSAGSLPAEALPGAVRLGRSFPPPQQSGPAKRGKERSLTVVFLSGKAMTDLNFRFRGKNRLTDVLSFAPVEEGDFGEIALYCDPERAKRLKLTVREEIFYLLLHGILHLSGFRHDKEPDASKMFALQDSVFEQWLSSANSSSRRLSRRPSRRA